MSFKVHLDPGHYGKKYNKSTTGLNYYESEMTWKLSQYLKAELEQRGVIVTLSRHNINSNPGLYDRGYGAKGCDLFLSLHSNACGTESVDYPIVYRGYDKTQANDFAKKLSDMIHNLMNTKSTGRVGTRKGNNGEYYGVLRGARAAGLTYYYIIEHSFHTNTNATKWLMSDTNLRLLAKEEAKFIVNYFVKNNTSAPNVTPAPATTTSVTNSQYIVNGIDYSLVFNPTYYANKYPDLKAAFGINTTNLFNHFVNNGMSEGRQASSNFNVTVYKNNYADLRSAFGNNLPLYYKHYIQHGQAEGRKAI